MEQINTLAKGAGIAFAGIVLSKLLGFLYRLIVARVGSEQYGLISIALGVISLLVLFPLMGLDSGVERYVAYFDGKKNSKKIYQILTSSLGLSLVLSLFFSLLLFIFSDRIAVTFFHNIKLGLVLKFFSITIPFYTVDRISLAALRAIKKNQYEVYSKVLFHNLTKITLTILFVYILRLELFGLSFAFLLSIIGMGLLSFYYVHKNIIKSVNNYKIGFVDKEVHFYSLHLMFYSFFYLILAWTDTLMIGSFLGASQAGIYNVALPTASLLVILPVALMSLFLPTITTLYAQNEKEKIKKVYDTMGRWIFFTNLPLLLLVLLFSKQILKILFGSEYTVGFVSLMMLGIGYFLFSFLDISSEILNMLKKSRLILLNSMIVASLNVVLNFLLIPKYGINGGATATMISLILLGLLSCSEAWYFTRLHPLKKDFLKLLIILGITSMTVFGLGKIVNVVTFMDLVFFSFYFIGIYTALALLTKSFRKEDVDLLKMVLVKTKNLIEKPINK